VKSTRSGHPASYRLFQPPMPLDFEDWSAREAKSYFEWFVSQIDDRLDELHRLVERARTDCRLDLTPESLACLGEFFVDEVSTRPSTPEETIEDWLALPARLVARYDGPGQGFDWAQGVATSPDGSRVYVTGGGRS